MLKTLCCPLCWKKTTDGEERAFLLHISRHLEEIALAALPRGAGSEDKSDASDSDTRSEEAPSLGRDREISKDREGKISKAPLESWGPASDEDIEKARQYWGYLFTPEKTPTAALKALLESIAIYIVRADCLLFVHDMSLIFFVLDNVYWRYQGPRADASEAGRLLQGCGW